MNAFIIELEDRPGALAGVAEAIAGRGINITGVSGIASGPRGTIAAITNDEAGTRSALDGAGIMYREIGLVSASLEDRPGTLAAAARRLADAGVNIEILIPTGMDAGKITLAIGVADVEAAKRALGELAGVSS